MERTQTDAGMGMIESWLSRQAKSSARTLTLGGVGLFAVGVVALFITFRIVYAVICFGMDWIVPHSHGTRMWVCGGVLLLLFVLNPLTDRRELESLSVTSGATGDRPVSISVPLVGRGSTVNPLAPDSARSIVRIISGMLLIGPRLIQGAWHFFGRARFMTSLATFACASVLSLLARKEKRVPFSAIVERIPPGHNIVDVLTQLQELEGVMVIRKEPAGLTLVSELRDELRGMLPKRKGKRRRPSPGEDDNGSEEGGEHGPVSI